jgi:hypothetical protein
MINTAIENHYNNMICSCGELFVRLNAWAPDDHLPHTDTNIVISDEARAKIAEYKATLTQFRKNRILLNKKLKEESTSFKEDVKPLLEQIKERRKTALESLKNSDIYKGTISVIRSLRTKLTRFRNTFDFNRETEIKELYGGHTCIYYDLRYSYPTSTVRRSFRLKLNVV